jgi:hypothetical protein
MKNKNKSSVKKIILTAILFATVTTSCKKDYFDINTDPNHAADVPVNLLLPSAEAAIAHTLGNDMYVNGGIWAQYWTQSNSASQYKSLEQYNPSANDFDYIWAILYSDALADLKTIDLKAAGTGQMQYIACSKILQAYAFQLLTDNFGDIPFSQALKAEEGILEPVYDDDRAVYDGILNLINEGLSLIDDNVTTSTLGAPGTADIIFNGNMHLWRKFGNTLKLRVYLRMSEAEPATAQAGIAAMGTPEFLGHSEMVEVHYNTSGGNTNPFYAQIVGLGNTPNLVASATTINFYQANNDPRINVFYIPYDNLGNHAGIPQGDYNSTADASLPSAVTGAHANDEASALAPVVLMSSYESLFLQAEAAQRGWLAGSAQALYEAAIHENFAVYGLQDSLATNYIAQPSVAFPATDQIKAIITQKWAAMCGNQNNEAWTEWRRTGFPDFLTPSVTALFSGMPNRYLYPQSEIDANGHHPNPLPGTVTTVTDKVWWDVN